MTFIDLLDRSLVFVAATILALVSLFFVILPGVVLCVVLFLLFLLILLYEQGRKLFS